MQDVQQTPETTNQIVPLEELFKNDVRGVELKKLRDELFDLEARVRREVDAGMSPADFKNHEALAVAVRTCMEVINAGWNKQHSAAGVEIA